LQGLANEVENNSSTGLSTIRHRYGIPHILHTSDTEGKKLIENIKE
jgi:hypothetical protein